MSSDERERQSTHGQSPCGELPHGKRIVRESPHGDAVDEQQMAMRSFHGETVSR